MKDVHVCTKEEPYEKGNPDRDGRKVQHPKASEVGDQEDGWPGGDIIRMKCPICGTRWKKELPQ